MSCTRIVSEFLHVLQLVFDPEIGADEATEESDVDTEMPCCENEQAGMSVDSTTALEDHEDEDENEDEEDEDEDEDEVTVGWLAQY